MAGDVGGRSCTDAELLLHPELLSQEFLLLTLEQVGRWGRLRTDGQPGGPAGLREARGRSPPTQIQWGLPPSDPQRKPPEWLEPPRNPQEFGGGVSDTAACVQATGCGIERL